MKGKEVQIALHVGRSLGERVLAIGEIPSALQTFENLLRYVEGLNDVRTTPRKMCASVHRGQAGEMRDCRPSILLDQSFPVSQ